MNIGRYQFILWPHWGFLPYHAVKDPPLGYVYDRLGMNGPLEIRRFVLSAPIEVEP
jgi:hypothetical protein